MKEFLITLHLDAHYGLILRSICMHDWLVMCLQVLDPEAPTQTTVADGKVSDTLKEWADKASKQYQEDGNADGWDSEDTVSETAEQKYIRVREFY